LGIGIVLGEIGVDGALQIDDRAGGATTDALAGHFSGWRRAAGSGPRPRRAVRAVNPVLPSNRSFNISSIVGIVLDDPEYALTSWSNPARHRAEFSFLLHSSFFQAAQHFGDAPGLRDAAARSKRRLGVEDFAD
jgi:hypothetical protein